VEVYALGGRLLDGWKSPAVASYQGAHGMHVEKGTWER
jgi:hypothetical protein